jgi:mlo protein
MILAVGMKLQQIITNLAVEVRGGVQKIQMGRSSHRLGKRESSGHEDNNTAEHQKCNPIKPRDDLFWFKWPRFLLFLIHFILFQVR